MENIIIEAGEAFGSGAHPSTALSLEWLGLLAPAYPAGRMLDIGCGSGILTVAAAKLHGVQVVASDLQPAAVSQTLENARLNDVEALIKAVRADGVRHAAIRDGAPYDLLFVNILYEVFLPWLPELKKLLADNGSLVLAGILRWQAEALREACEVVGLDVQEIRLQGDWVACHAKQSTFRHSERM